MAIHKLSRETRIKRPGSMVRKPRWNARVVFYGGSFTPDGPGHGHVKATGGPLGENIVYWRLPYSEGGQVIVSNSWDTMYGNDLRDHLSGF